MTMGSKRGSTTFQRDSDRRIAPSDSEFESSDADTRDQLGTSSSDSDSEDWTPRPRPVRGASFRDRLQQLIQAEKSKASSTGRLPVQGVPSSAEHSLFESDRPAAARQDSLTVGEGSPHQRTDSDAAPRPGTAPQRMESGGRMSLSALASAPDSLLFSQSDALASAIAAATSATRSSGPQAPDNNLQNGVTPHAAVPPVPESAAADASSVSAARPSAHRDALESLAGGASSARLTPSASRASFGAPPTAPHLSQTMPEALRPSREGSSRRPASSSGHPPYPPRGGLTGDLGRKGAYIDMLQSLSASGARKPGKRKNVLGEVNVPEGLSGQQLQQWAQRLVRQCEAQVKRVQTRLAQERKEWMSQREELTLELEELRSRGLHVDEEVQKAVAEAQEEAEERLRETEDRHRKLIDRLEKHTRQALKARDVAAEEKVSETRKELDHSMQHFEVVAERTLDAYVKVKHWARKKLVLRDWLAMARETRAAKVHKSLAAAKDREATRIQEKLTRELDDHAQRQTVRMALHAWRLVAAGERSRDHVADHLVRFKRRTWLRGLFLEWRDVAGDLARRRHEGEKWAEERKRECARDTIAAWASYTSRRAYLRRRLAHLIEFREGQSLSHAFERWRQTADEAAAAREEAETRGRERVAREEQETTRRAFDAWAEIARGNEQRGRRIGALLQRVELGAKRAAFQAWMEHTRARQVVRVYTDGLAATQTSRVRRTAFAWWAAHTRNMACRRGIAASRASLAEMRTAREAFWAWVGYARGDHIDIDTSAHETEASDGDAASDAHGGPARSAVSEKHSLAALSARVRALSVPEVLSSLCKPTSVRRFQAAVLLAWHSQAQRSTRQGSRGPDAARQRAPKAGPREYTRAGSMAGSRMTRSGRYADAEVSQKPDAVPTPPRSTASAGEKMAALRRDLERVRKEKDRVMGLLRALQASSAAKVGEERDRVARITERAADTLFRQRARATLSKYLWRWSAAVRAPPPGRPAGSSPGLSPRMPPRGQGGEDPRWGSPVRQAAVSGSRAELSPRGYAGRPGRLERGRGETGEFSSPPRGIFVQDAPNTPQESVATSSGHILAHSQPQAQRGNAEDGGVAPVGSAPGAAQKKINFVAFRERIASGTKLMTQSSMGATSASSMGAPPGGVPGGQAVQGGGRLFQGHPALSGHHVPQSTLPVTERTGAAGDVGQEGTAPDRVVGVGAAPDAFVKL